MPLMELYLHPPKTVGLAALAALAPPPNRLSDVAQLHQTSIPQLSDEKLTLAYARARL
jgi:hypothetical protein